MVSFSPFCITNAHSVASTNHGLYGNVRTLCVQGSESPMHSGTEGCVTHAEGGTSVHRWADNGQGAMRCAGLAEALRDG